jgi:hypothetical protein
MMCALMPPPAFEEAWDELVNIMWIGVGRQSAIRVRIPPNQQRYSFFQIAPVEQDNFLLTGAENVAGLEFQAERRS